jgi:hypothetical protein
VAVAGGFGRPGLPAHKKQMEQKLLELNKEYSKMNKEKNEEIEKLKKENGE